MLIASYVLASLKESFLSLKQNLLHCAKPSTSISLGFFSMGLDIFFKCSNVLSHLNDFCIVLIALKWKVVFIRFCKYCHQSIEAKKRNLLQPISIWKFSPSYDVCRGLRWIIGMRLSIMLQNLLHFRIWPHIFIDDVQWKLVLVWH